jgi:hypothetical protein
MAGAERTHSRNGTERTERPDSPLVECAGGSDEKRDGSLPLSQPSEEAILGLPGNRPSQGRRGASTLEPVIGGKVRGEGSERRGEESPRAGHVCTGVE